MFAAVVYLMCAITSGICTVMLLRGYWRTGMRLLLWSGLCFVALTANNILLFVDLIILSKDTDLSVLRSITNWIGMMLLMYGLIWETR